MKNLVNNIKERIVIGNRNKKVTERNSIMKESVVEEEKFDQRMFDVKLAAVRELRKAKKEGRTVDHVEFMANELVKYDKRKKEEAKKQVEEFVEEILGKEVVEEIKIREANEEKKNMTTEASVESKNDKEKANENSNVKKYSRKGKSNGSTQMSLIDAIDKMNEYANGGREVELTNDGFMMYESWEDFMRANDNSEQSIESWVEN